MRLFKRKKPAETERRRFIRITNYARINYQIGNEQARYSCRSADISESGIRFNLYQKLKVGTSLKLFIHFEDVAEPVCVFGKVAWIKEIRGREYPFEIGINFDFVTPSLQSKLKNLIQGESSSNAGLEQG